MYKFNYEYFPNSMMKLGECHICKKTETYRTCKKCEGRHVCIICDEIHNCGMKSKPVISLNEEIKQAEITGRDPDDMVYLWTRRDGDKRVLKLKRIDAEELIKVYEYDGVVCGIDESV